MAESLKELKLYTLKEVAEILSVTERTLHTYIKSGKLKGQKIGGRWRVSESNLKNFIGGTE